MIFPLNSFNNKHAATIKAPDKKSSSLQQLDNFGNPLGMTRASTGPLHIRILIPKAASGVLIGRQGTVIKHMSEISNCKIQLGDESDPFETKERMVLVTGPTIGNVVQVTSLIPIV